MSSSQDSGQDARPDAVSTLTPAQRRQALFVLLGKWAVVLLTGVGIYALPTPDGITDAAVLRVYEGRFRAPERHEPKWLEHQTGKIERGLAAIENALPAIEAEPHVGAIALACTLGYLDLRTPDWRADHPRLGEWVDAFEIAIPAFAETRPK